MVTNPENLFNDVKIKSQFFLTAKFLYNVEQKQINSDGKIMRKIEQRKRKKY